MENTDSIYKKAAEKIYFSCDQRLQKSLNEATFKINTRFCIVEIWTESAKIAEKLGKKKNILKQKLLSVFPEHWEMRIVLDRCHSKKNIILWSSEHLDYLVAAHEKQPTSVR
jgi:hypothetical protein